ncbi:MAG: hypothetical protein PUA90_00050 [bacterium]|nr:hypothetical protein [bacterium]
MNKNKKRNIIVKLFMLIFIFFLIIYLSKEAGYYEYKMYNKTKLTQEAILKFENDVNEGKDVSIEDYVIDDYVDYTNTFTDIGYNIGEFIEGVMNKGIKKTLDVFRKLFYE